MGFKTKEEDQAYHRSYYLKHKEEQSKKARNRYLKNRDKKIAYQRQYNLNNTEKIAAQHKEYYESHKKEVLEKCKEWASNNREKSNEIKTKYRNAHMEQHRAYNREYAKINRPKAMARRKIKRLDPIEAKREKLWDRHKITLKDFNSMLLNQDNKCGICNGPFTNKEPFIPCVDHDHGPSGKIRGLLCRHCNSGMGGFKDDPELLSRAIDWLQGTTVFKKCAKKEIKELKIRPQRKYANKRKFGITLDQFNSMMADQGYECGICGKNIIENVNNIDHDHTSSKIRGVLCAQCNRSIGLLQDNIKIIQNAITWLRKDI